MLWHIYTFIINERISPYKTSFTYSQYQSTSLWVILYKNILILSIKDNGKFFPISDDRDNFEVNTSTTVQVLNEAEVFHEMRLNWLHLCTVFMSCAAGYPQFTLTLIHKCDQIFVELVSL